MLPLALVLLLLLLLTPLLLWPSLPAPWAGDWGRGGALATDDEDDAGAAAVAVAAVMPAEGPQLLLRLEDMTHALKQRGKLENVFGSCLK